MYLIVGATGSLGGRVAKELLSRGERVKAVARAESPLRKVGRFTDPDELERLGAEVVEADLNRPETIEPHLEGVNSVLMTASGTKRMPFETLDAVDHRGAGALADAAKRAGADHFVYLSAGGAGPDAHPFLRPKWQGENAIRDSGLAATFVRPSLYMQDWIGFVLGAQLQGGAHVQLVGEQDPIKSFVDEGDVVKLVTALLLEGPPQDGEPTRTIEYGAEAASHGDILGRMATLSGLPLTVERIPAGEKITTVPQPVATTLTELLTLAAAIPDVTLVTPDVSERYGIEPVGIDDFLKQMFAVPA